MAGTNHEEHGIIRAISNEKPICVLIRLLIVALLLLACVFWSASLFTSPERYPWILFSLEGLRFWIFPLAAFGSALLLAGHYARDLHELPKTSDGIRHVVAGLFGISVPVLKIEKGEMVLDPQRPNRLELIGGPGRLNVIPGNLVLLENDQGPSNVCGAGFHYVSRREKIRAVASQEDQLGYVESRKATTKDGIEIEVKEIRYLYHLWPSRKSGEYSPRSPVNPFPYSMQSLRKFAYNRLVNQDGLTSVPDAMNLIVGAAIADYINSHRFDDLATPNPDVSPQPRDEIWSNLFTQENFQERFRNLGMELIWVDIGHFDVSEDVWNWRVLTWGAKWRGPAYLRRRLGQIRGLTYERIARAEGRADALRLIIDELEEARLLGTPAQNLRKLVLLYTAQIMDELSASRKLIGQFPDNPPQLGR
jgi:hypothetical protein